MMNTLHSLSSVFALTCFGPWKMNIIAMVVVQKGNIGHTVQELLKDDHNERDQQLDNV